MTFKQYLVGRMPRDDELGAFRRKALADDAKPDARTWIAEVRRCSLPRSWGLSRFRRGGRRYLHAKKCIVTGAARQGDVSCVPRPDAGQGVASAANAHASRQR